MRPLRRTRRFSRWRPRRERMELRIFIVLGRIAFRGTGRLFPRPCGGEPEIRGCFPRLWRRFLLAGGVAVNGRGLWFCFAHDIAHAEFALLTGSARAQPKSWPVAQSRYESKFCFAFYMYRSRKVLGSNQRSQTRIYANDVPSTQSSFDSA